MSLSFLQRDSVRLAGVLAIAAVLAFLFRDGPDAAASAVRNPQARAAMPEISAPDLEGHPWSLAGQRGSIVLVNFWASWCPPCRAETPGLVRISKEYRGRGIEIVGASMDDTAEPVRNFVARYQVPYTVIRPDLRGGLASAIESLPTSFLVDRQGRVAKTYVGGVRETTLKKDLDWLLTEQ